MGDSQSIIFDLPELHIRRCTGWTCKTDEEITAFINDMQIAIVLKDNTFNRENYNDSETVK